ncbi:hypothetical protein HID58_093551 [Brassica napus]|uniref:Uncharacterized protein n=1 Tax=Brassica napus TaxID=3708 RepID=A0ABQ7XDA9_BRANA|nr:hypothetical protein HID58_093551 [Brassica napus]
MKYWSRLEQSFEAWRTKENMHWSIQHLMESAGIMGKKPNEFGALERQGKVSDLPEAQKKKSRLRVFNPHA